MALFQALGTKHRPKNATVCATELANHAPAALEGWLTAVFVRIVQVAPTLGLAEVGERQRAAIAANVAR